MSSTTSIQNLPPVPTAVTITVDGQIVSNTWNQWFVQLQQKVNLINARLAATSTSTATLTPGTYGSTTQVPEITVDQYGNITAITQVTPAGASPLTTKGDIYTYSTTNDRLPVGPAGYVLTASPSTPTGLAWAAATTPTLPVTTKGDILGFDTVADRIPVGTDGQVLTADSTTALGVSWKTPGSSTVANINNLTYWFMADIPKLNSSTIYICLPSFCPWFPSLSANGGGATRSSTLLNSLGVASFPGTSASLYTLTYSIPLSICTVFAVVNLVNAPNSAGHPIVSGPTGCTEVRIEQTSFKISINKSQTVNIGTSTGALTSGTWAQFNATYDGTSTYAFRIAQASAGSGTNAVSITANSTSIGADSITGGTIGYTDGSIAEIIIYNRVLTLTEIQSVESYLHTKWGV